MAKPPEGTYTKYPKLAALPLLVRRQRKVEARIAAVAGDVELDKAIRAEIDQLLVDAGLQGGDVVTCAGYDVKHNERNGQSRLNTEKLTEQLVAAGVDRELVDQVVKDSTDSGDPIKFATVKPAKGAKVRT